MGALETVEAVYRAFEQRDVDRFVELIHDDCVITQDDAVAGACIERCCFKPIADPANSVSRAPSTPLVQFDTAPTYPDGELHQKDSRQSPRNALVGLRI